MKVSRPTDDRPAYGAESGEFPAALTLSEAEAVPGVLGRITAERVVAYRNAPSPPLAEATATRPGFAAALRAPGLQIIAEIKRKSPSLGAIAELEPRAAAGAYAAGGAAALSILTEPNYFGGELSHLQEVARTATLPLLRKDFTVHPAQLFEAKAAGASAVLLIVAVLGEQVRDYLELARSLALDALVEVHDEAELTTALASGAEIIGVNNRDLKTLLIDLTTSPRLLRAARETGFSGVLVAESGYGQAAQLIPVLGLADAVLIGSSVAGSGDLEAAVRTFRQDLAGLEARV